MSRSSELANQLGRRCIEVLSHIWKLYLERKEWPTTRRVHSDLGKPFVIDALKQTNGSVITEMQSGGIARYQLFGVAPLLTYEGSRYHDLLLQYLELLRKTFREDPEKRAISNLDVLKALSLSAADCELLYHLILVTRLFDNSASFGSEGWSVGILEKSEDLQGKDLSDALDELLFHSYNPLYPIFPRSNQAGSSIGSIHSAMSDGSSGIQVFIAYSHDSAEHKRWVLKLSVELEQRGVKVVVDQRNLRFGKEVTKFMEESIVTSDRVLMICTKRYVAKVEAREGGVGYEAGIISAELLERFGTEKFIPVIKQRAKHPLLPTVLKGRFFVNLSHGRTYRDQFERLIRELGGTSTGSQNEVGETSIPKTVSTQRDIRVTELKEFMPANVIQEAHQLILNDDRVGWKTMRTRLLKEASSDLSALDSKLRAYSPDTKGRMECLHLWSEKYQPVFAMSVVGAMASRDPFASQISLVDDLFSPPGYRPEVGTLTFRMPEVSVFLFHILHGAACVEAGQFATAMALASTRFKSITEPQGEFLFLTHPFIGWFEGECGVPWLFLSKLPGSWPWLADVFGGVEHCLASICAYYAFLNVAELAYSVRAGRDLGSHTWMVDVPLCFNQVSQQIANRALRLLFRPDHDLSAAWNAFDVSRDQMKFSWEAWKAVCYRWLSSLYNRGVLEHELLHYQLFNK